jgi:hypothetical protein
MAGSCRNHTVIDLVVVERLFIWQFPRTYAEHQKKLVLPARLNTQWPETIGRQICIKSQANLNYVLETARNRPIYRMQLSNIEV